MNPFLMRRMFMTEKNMEKLEYIQSAGTQYIDTEYIPKMNTVLEMDIQFIENKNTMNPNLILSTENNFFGVSEQVNSFTANFGGNTSQHYNIFYWNNIRGGQVYGVMYQDVRKRSLFRLTNNNVAFQNRKDLLSEKSGNQTENMFLFGANRSHENKKVCLKRYDMRLYGCKIYEDDVLIKDFIPAKVGEKVGLYDTVSKKFHENKGTGEFLYAVKE